MKPQANERIAKALLQKVDRTFQRCYHQSLTDIVQDLRMHNVLRSVDPSPRMLLKTIHCTGLLHMSSSSAILEMKTVVKRFVSGTINICTRCGKRISSKDLERDPTITLCTNCREQAQVREESL